MKGSNLYWREIFESKFCPFHMEIPQTHSQYNCLYCTLVNIEKKEVNHTFSELHGLKLQSEVPSNIKIGIAYKELFKQRSGDLEDIRFKTNKFDLELIKLISQEGFYR